MPNSIHAKLTSQLFSRQELIRSQQLAAIVIMNDRWRADPGAYECLDAQTERANVTFCTIR